MRWDIVDGHVTDDGAVVSVSPQVLFLHESELESIDILKVENWPAYANGVLSPCTNPRRFSQTEGHIRWLIENVQLIKGRIELDS
jgi:hypothetical protein